MQRILATIAFVSLFPVQTATACEAELACDKCAKQSEYSWNPDQEYKTQRLHRFYSLNELINTAYTAQDGDAARALIAEFLELAAVYRCNWNYGNAIHDGNRILGLISVRNGDLNKAAGYLLLAGKSTGSPQLNSFGPELDLANKLLKKGKTEQVLAYLKDIQSFWELDEGRVGQWIEKIERGGEPKLARF